MSRAARAKRRRGRRGSQGGAALLGRGTVTGREWTEGDGGETMEESRGFDTGEQNDRRRGVGLAIGADRTVRSVEYFNEIQQR